MLNIDMHNRILIYTPGLNRTYESFGTADKSGRNTRLSIDLTPHHLVLYQDLVKQ